MAAKDTHEAIVLSDAPKGRFIEGIVSGTPKPGTIMEVTNTAIVNGKATWQIYTPGADGDRPIGPMAILREDELQGRDKDTAYVTGTKCFLYCPIPGDELLLLVKNIAGTSDSFAIADKLIIDNGTGKGIATTGTPETEPFIVMETVSAITVDTLVHVMYSGY